jgi:hypothetical protein
LGRSAETEEEEKPDGQSRDSAAATLAGPLMIFSTNSSPIGEIVLRS